MQRIAPADICGSTVLVSVVIKALNEERNIAGAIESALAGLEGISGEVILADSASTDRTVEIARRYPIKIVTLANAQDRSCGAGGQLGYQYAKGAFVCIIDGDMRLYPRFLRSALDFLERNPKIAGVGGLIRESETGNVEFQSRQSRADPDREAGPVTRLDCGGIYRRQAIESVGYFTDRNLHGGEELELASRLAAAGWQVARINEPSIDHFGHAKTNLSLLRHRFVYKTAYGTGEVLRATFGRASFAYAFRNNNALLICAIVHAWWLTILAMPFVFSFPLAALFMLAVFAFPFAVMSLKWRSVTYGIYAVSAWNVYALGFWFGLLQRRIDPATWIDSNVVAANARSQDMVEGEAHRE